MVETSALDLEAVEEALAGRRLVPMSPSKTLAAICHFFSFRSPDQVPSEGWRRAETDLEPNGHNPALC
jgi:hypothetical protein